MEFHRLYAGDPEMVIPRVIRDLSSRRVLTMTYVDGYRLSDLMNPAADLELRKWVTRKYYELVWRQMLEFGVLHTDPHPGNYLVTHHPHICVLDFGSIRHFPEPMRHANLQFARALVERNDHALGQALVKLGYLDRGQNPRPMIEAIHMLFEPVLEDRLYGPGEYDLVGKAHAGGRDRVQAQTLQVARAQRIHRARAGRTRRHHARARRAHQLP